jgi:hypothetical protein
LWRHDHVAQAIVRIRVDARRPPIGCKEADARPIGHHPSENAVSTGADPNRDPEPLPRPPLTKVALEDGRVVQPNLDGALDGDDEVLLSRGREEGLNVEHPLFRILGARREAAVLLDP